MVKFRERLSDAHSPPQPSHLHCLLCHTKGMLLPVLTPNVGTGGKLSNMKVIARNTGLDGNRINA